MSLKGFLTIAALAGVVSAGVAVLFCALTGQLGPGGLAVSAAGGAALA